MISSIAAPGILVGCLILYIFETDWVHEILGAITAIVMSMWISKCSETVPPKEVWGMVDTYLGKKGLYIVLEENKFYPILPHWKKATTARTAIMNISFQTKAETTDRGPSLPVDGNFTVRADLSRVQVYLGIHPDDAERVKIITEKTRAAMKACVGNTIKGLTADELMNNRQGVMRTMRQTKKLPEEQSLAISIGDDDVALAEVDFPPKAEEARNITAIMADINAAIEARLKSKGLRKGTPRWAKAYDSASDDVLIGSGQGDVSKIIIPGIADLGPEGMRMLVEMLKSRHGGRSTT